jgi:hypothetical protein
VADLEDTIRDLAKRGELTHLSLAPNPSGKGWRATFAPASVFGVCHGGDEDPVKAMLLAIDGAKIRRKAPFKDDSRIGQSIVDVKPSADAEADSLM